MAESKGSGKQLLARSEMLRERPLRRELVRVPEWGGQVLVRELTGEERDQFEAGLVEQRQRGGLNLKNLRARLVVLAVCDEAGARIFSDLDADALGRQGAAPVGRLYDVAARLSGLSRQDEDELLGKSKPTPGGSLCSPAPCG